MNSELSFFHLILNASGIVQLVMALLVLASIASWAIILDRARALKRERSETARFESRFWSGGDMADLFRRIDKEDPVGLATVFHAGFREYLRSREQSQMARGVVIENAQRAMRVAIGRAGDRLQRNLSVLATVGSTSPYEGLFGTVWGIMNAFHALGDVKQATLNLVAPGIAEALIATAMGLFAAIPAVIAYNRYSHDVEQLENRFEDFSEEFSNVLSRQLHAPAH